MLLVDLNKRSLERLKQETLKQAGLLERQDVQDLICRNPAPFCDELQEYIHIVGSEIEPTAFVQDRVDVLGVDTDGAAVIIEIKRASHKLHLLQAISYAAMISKWTEKQFFEKLQNYNDVFLSRKQSLQEAGEELIAILEEGDPASINKYQRIVLIAEDFDYEVLVTAEWLTESYDMDIRCFRIELAKHEENIFLSFNRTYPPPELTEVAKVRRRRNETGINEPADWIDILAKIKNQAVISFFQKELAESVENNPTRKTLKYRDQLGIRFRVSAKQDFATVVQNGRFDNDEAFWKERLGSELGFRTRQGGKRIAFRLISSDNFNQFLDALQSLKSAKFAQISEEADDDLSTL